MASDHQRAEAKLQEAERLVQDAAERAGGFVARLLARSREELEDIWAEARSVNSQRK